MCSLRTIDYKNHTDASNYEKTKILKFTETSYERAQLQNKLLNYASELNGRLETDTFKQLASGEPIEARRIYGEPFMMCRYAKLIFNANELPREVEYSHAFFRRFIIIPFQQTIPEQEQDPQLAQKIISSELPGVFNWVLTGLKRLLQNRKFTESEIARKQVEEYKLESDSVAMFLSEYNFKPSNVEYRKVSDFYIAYKNFCESDGYRALGKGRFTKRCRTLGLVTEKKREHVIYVACNESESEATGSKGILQAGALSPNETQSLDSEAVEHCLPSNPSSCDKSQLDEHKQSIEDEFRQRPAASIKEAGERIFQLTNIRRSDTRVEVFLKRSGFKFRKPGGIPAKADLAAQEEFLKKNLNLR